MSTDLSVVFGHLHDDGYRDSFEQASVWLYLMILILNHTDFM